MKAIIVLVLLTSLWMIAAVLIMQILKKAWRLERENYKGKRIPTGFGFLLVLTAVPIYTYISVMTWPDREPIVLAAAVLGFGIVGLLDDLYGTRDVGGFRGHFGLLRKGRITTGLIKVVVGGILALGLGAVAADFDIFATLLNGLVISLTANMLNLLDLRPGRAVSCFWLGIIILAAARLGEAVHWRYLIPVFVPAIWLTVQDRSARIMIGDAGSNVLGAVLGLVFAYALGIPAKVALIVFMIAVHVYSEKYSISKSIESSRLLRGIDRLLGER